MEIEIAEIEHPGLDCARTRADTPGVANRLHFNNAGSALQPSCVTEAVKEHIDLESAIGGYEAEELNHDRIERVYGALSSLLNCKPEELAFIENATRAWDMAFYSLDLSPGDVILTGMNEYASNYIAFMQRCRKTGAIVKVVPNDETGQLDLAALRKMMDGESVKLIAITHVATNGGLVQPVQEVGALAREFKVRYLIDACQSAGQMDLDVARIGCDMLSATGRKYLRGPRGTGFLFVKEELARNIEPVFLDLHAAQWVERDRYVIREDARRFENWEQNFAGKLGLAVAVDYLLDLGIKPVQERIFYLASRLRERLSIIDGVKLGDTGRVKCGITTFYSEKVAAPQIVSELAKKNINTTYTTEFSTRLDMTDRKLPSMVRASVHYYNTEDEIERFALALEEILG